MRPRTRILLLSVGIFIVAFESAWFTKDPSWISALVAFFLLVPAVFGGRVQG